MKHNIIYRRNALTINDKLLKLKSQKENIKSFYVIYPNTELYLKLIDLKKQISHLEHIKEVYSIK